MSVPYPSDAWIKELQKVCNGDDQFKDACGSFSGKMVYQIDAEPGKLDKTAYLYFWPDRGVAREAMELSSIDERSDVDYILAGKYSVWKEVVKGKQEPLRALMTRKLKLTKGSQLAILKQVKLALRIMHNCTLLPATFPDE